MRMLKNTLTFIFLILNLSSWSLADVLPIKNNIKNSFNSKVTSTINKASSAASKTISNFATENFDFIKYLDFEIENQEHLKPSVNFMSVNEILKINSGTIFNQTSLNNHDGDQTINLGLGVRKLLNENKILFGSNIFYDHQFAESHKRSGAGVEAISSVFDVRGNYYNAISGTRNTSEGSETALNGWDLGTELHLQGKYNVNAFATLFDFENPNETSSYREEGNKVGVNATFGHFLVEAGYLNDNQLNDSFFANIKFVINMGGKNKKPKEFAKYVDVSDKLYQPVKRENKIRVVKIDSSGLVAGGF